MEKFIFKQNKNKIPSPQNDIIFFFFLKTIKARQNILSTPVKQNFKDPYLMLSLSQTHSIVLWIFLFLIKEHTTEVHKSTSCELGV